MRATRTESRTADALANLVGDQHAAVMSARATERDRKITLPLFDIVRQEIDEQIRDAFDEFPSLRKRPDVARHARVAARKLLERGYVVRIRKKPHVENQVAIGRNTVPESERIDINADLAFLRAA